MNHLFPEEHSQLRLAIYHDSAVLCTTNLVGEHQQKKADVPTLPPPAFETASTQQVPLKLHLRPPPSRLTFRATHARPLQPAALAFVSYGFVLVRVRVQVHELGQLMGQVPLGALPAACPSGDEVLQQPDVDDARTAAQAGPRDARRGSGRRRGWRKWRGWRGWRG